MRSLFNIRTNRHYYLYDYKSHNYLLISKVISIIIDFLDKEKKNIYEFKLEDKERICRKYNLLKIEVDKAIEKIKFYFQKGLISFDRISNKIGRFRISQKELEQKLSNLNTVIVETTEKCNLDCYYCTYGNLYKQDESRCQKNNLSEKCMVFMKRLIQLQKTSMCQASKKILNVSFYGGEPLLNFKLIEKLVLYCNSCETDSFKVKYGMTTNGTLLNDYLPFLMRNDFKIFISIDGNSQQNSYRTFKNGKPSFEGVMKNIKQIKENNKEFYEKNVEFLSVLHDRNSIGAVYKYINNEFNKIASLSELSLDNRSDDRLLSVYRQKLYSDSDKLEIDKVDKRILNSKDGKYDFLVKTSNTYVGSFKALFFDSRFRNEFPTETCIPFSARIFINSNGDLLPCEKVNTRFVFGKVNGEEIEFYVDKINDTLERFYDKLKPYCENCYNFHSCDDQCYFTTPSTFDSELACFISERDFQDKIMKQIELFEIDLE